MNPTPAEISALIDQGRDWLILADGSDGPDVVAAGLELLDVLADAVVDTPPVSYANGHEVRQILTGGRWALTGHDWADEDWGFLVVLIELAVVALGRVAR